MKQQPAKLMAKITAGIVREWLSIGLDTMSIANVYHVPESTIYNLLRNSRRRK